MGIWKLGVCMLCAVFETAGFIRKQRQNEWSGYEIETRIINFSHKSELSKRRREKKENEQGKKMTEQSIYSCYCTYTILVYVDIRT